MHTEIHQQIKFRSIIMKANDLYTMECIKASLERAMVQVAWNFNDSTECKEMITNPDNIVIL